MLQTWFKIFFRNQKKNWLNSLVNILGLTIGFGVLILVLLYLNDEKSYNAENTYKEEIYRVVHKMSDGAIWANSTVVEGDKYKEDIPEVEDIYMSHDWYMSKLVNIKSKKQYTRGILEGHNNFFDFFPFEIVAGSTQKFKEARNHVAISEKLAKDYFGNVSPIGKVISINKRTLLVTTVFKISGKHFFEPQMVTQYEEDPTGHWGSFSYNLFIKTIPNASKADLIQKMNNIWVKNQSEPQAKKDGMSIEEWEEKYGTKVLLENLKDVRLHGYTDDAGPEGKGSYQLIMTMLSLSILLLLISCVNFINLSIASATQRAKEVGVKKTLGLSKSRLIGQYALEIIVQGIIAYILALLLVELILPSFNEFMGKKVVLFTQVNLLFNILCLAIALAFIVGYIPALYMAKFKSVEVLKGNISRSKKGILGRNIMLGVQFLISGFFLTASLIIYKQVNYMMEKDLGFSGEQIAIVYMSTPDSRYNKYLLAKNELIKHPNITNITSNYFVPNGGHTNSTNVDFDDKLSQAYGDPMDFEYIDMLAIEVLKGRKLKADFASDTINNILINETLAKELGIHKDPIGKKVFVGYNSKNYSVVGMVKDYHVFGLDNKIPPIFYFHWNTFDWMKQYNFYNIQFKIKASDIQSTMADIEKYWKQHVEQDYPFKYQFLDKKFQRSFTKYQRQKTLFLILTTIVIVISLLGLFALATLTIQQRLKEVAIRKTLGASIKEIMYQLVKSFLKITCIASIILIPIAYYFMQIWLENFAYRIEMPWVPYVVTPIILIVLVFVVVGLKAFKATKVDLIKYLKFE